MIGDRDTILELTSKIQEFNCMIQKNFRMLNQYAVDIHTLPVILCLSHLFKILAECWAVLWECIAATMGRQVIWDTYGISGNVFLQIQWRLLQHLIHKSPILGSLMYQNTHHHMWWVKAKHQLRIRDATQDRQPEKHSSLVREDLQRTKEQTNNDCSNVRLLEDKIQDWGMYLFTISYGSYAVDQRSGVGWISGWSQIFVICMRNSNARFWSTRCQDCFSTELNHP